MQALGVRCSGCGGSVPFDARLDAAACPYCRKTTAFDPPTLLRVRGHLERIAELERQTSAAAAGTATFRGMARPLGSILALTALAIVMVTLVAAAAHLIEPTPGMLLAVVLGFLVALVGAAALRRAGAVAVAARVVSAGCAFCGAHFPAPAGAALQCPFCFTSLVPGARLLSGQEHASATALHAQRSELGAAHAAFSRNNTRTLVAMLLVIGVPVVIFCIYALVLTVRMYAGMK